VRARHARVCIGLLVFLGWAVFVLSLSERRAAFADEGPRLQAVAALEPVVQAVAADGIGQLSAPSARVLLQDTGREPTLLALLAAWAKLSLGRIGLLAAVTCARLPWLVLCALGPVLLYGILLRARDALVAVAGAGALAYLFAGIAPSLLVGSAAANVGWLLLVLAPYLGTLKAERSARQRQCSALTAALAFAIALAVARSALWVGLVCMLHLSLAHWGSAWRNGRHGRLLLPSFVGIGLALAVPCLVVLNLHLWQATPVQVARFVLTPLGAATAPLELGAENALQRVLPVNGWVALAALAGFVYELAKARRVAPARRDRQALRAVIGVGLAVTLLLPLLVPTPLGSLRPPPEFSWPFWAMGCALCVGGVRDLALRAIESRRTSVADRPHST